MSETLVLIDPKNLRAQARWIVASILAVALMSVLYFASSVGRADWPGGGSLIGFAYGVVGGIIILFECFLWVRKRYLRAWRIGRTQVWLRAHVWFGLWTLPLLIYHSGFRLGGSLSTVLMVLLVIVVATGIWGLAMQTLIPRRMLDEVPAETIYSQIGHLTQQFADESRRLVEATCGAAVDADAPKREERGEYLTIGAVRSVGKLQGRVLQTRVPSHPVPHSESLLTFFRDSVDPFLRDGAKSRSPLTSPNRSAVLFEDLRTKLPPAAHEAAAALESLCEQRRQLDHQARLHAWLHAWLLVHLPLSGALLVLMFVHAFYAVKYW